MKIFLTGQMQIGKSTLINGAMQHFYPHCSIGGFRTITVPDIPNAIGSVYIVPVGHEPQHYDAHNRVGIRYGSQKAAVAFPKVFDTEGVRIIEENKKCELFIMDEIGILESSAHQFAAAVMERVDSNCHILGVLKHKKTDLLDKIRNHPDICLLEVFEENRDMLLGEIIRRMEGI